MPAPIKRLFVVVVCVLASWYAHKPLLGAGFLGSDAAVLDDVGAAFGAERADAPWSVEALDHRPLAAMSLAFSRSLHATGGVYTPGDAGRLRLESLLILVIAAFGVRSAVIRAMRPWTGEDHARGAGAAAGALLMVHPLIVPVVGHLTARGDVVALAASAWSAALLLKGRQERRTVSLGASFALALVAAAASPAALVLVPLGFGLEFVAASRHRRLRRKVRTAIQVAAGYGAALVLEAVVRAVAAPAVGTSLGLEGTGVSPAVLLAGQPSGIGHALFLAMEKTGVVVLPVNTMGVGTLGYVLAVLALLLALHPGFVAARAAPRLWGRVLGGWAIALLVLLALGMGERAIPAELSDAPGTLTLTVCMAVGLGISATALSGARRTALPALTGVLYCVLTAGSGSTIQEAAAETGALHEAILDARAHFEDQGQPVAAVWIMDPPRSVAGVETLQWHQDASLGAAPFLPIGAEPVVVRGLPSASFWVFATDPQFDAVREGGLVLLLPPESKGDPSEGPLVIAADGATAPPLDRPGRKRERIARDVTRRALYLGPAPGRAPGTGQSDVISWVGEGSSPAGVRFDPLRYTAIKASAPPATVDVAPPAVRFTGTSALQVDETERGVWIQGPRGPEAVFSLSSSPLWLLAGTIKSVWFLGDLRHAAATRLTPAPLPLPEGVQPRLVAEGKDWSFDVQRGSLRSAYPDSSSAEESWLLLVVDRQSGEAVQMVPSVTDQGRLLVPGAGVFHGAPVEWILDRRLDGVTVERARGRR